MNCTFFCTKILICQTSKKPQLRNRIFYKRAFLVCGLISWTFTSAAQMTYTDSLLHLLARSQPDTQRVRLLTALGAIYAEKDTAQMIKYVRPSLRLAQQLNDATGQMENYMQLGLMELNRGQYQCALDNYEKARKIAENNRNDNQKAATLDAVGRVMLQQGRRSEAIEYFDSAFKLLEKQGLTKQIGRLCNSLCVLLNETGNSERALSVALRGLGVAEKYQDIPIQISINNNIAKIFYDTKRYNEAIEYCNKAIEGAKKISDERNLGIAYLNLANQYEDGFQNHKKSAELYQAALELFQKIGLQRGIQAATNNLASLQYRIGNVDEALKLFHQNLLVNEKAESKVGLPMNYLNIGRVLLKKQQYNEAKIYFEKAETFGQKYAEAATVLEIWTYRAALDSAMGNYQSAYLYRNRQLALQDSMRSEKTNRSLSDMRVKYETAQKEQQITLLNTKNQVQQLSLSQQQLALRNNALALAQKTQSLQLSELSLENMDLELFKTNAEVREKGLENQQQQQQIQTLDAQNKLKALEVVRRNLWLMGLALLFTLSILLGYAFYSKRRAQQTAALQNAVNQQKILAAKSVLEAEERERRRIAGDLHDGVAQLVVASKMHLASIGHKMDFKTETDRAEYEKVLALITETADEIRAVSHTMMPNALLRVGLVSASSLASWLRSSGWQG